MRITPRLTKALFLGVAAVITAILSGTLNTGNVTASGNGCIAQHGCDHTNTTVTNNYVGSKRPSVTVRRGAAPGSLLLRLDNWEPNSAVTITMTGPDQRPVSVAAAYATRIVDSEGASETAAGNWFWLDSPSDLPGSYTINATSRNGQTASAAFTAPVGPAGS